MSKPTFEKTEKIIIDQNQLTKYLFFIVLGFPFELTALLFTFVSGDGMAQAENNVLIFGAILLLFDIFYLYLWKRKKLPPKFLLRIFGFFIKNNDITYKIAFHNDFTDMNDIKLVLTMDERISLENLCIDIIIKRLVIRLGLFLTTFTFIVIVLL